MAIESTQTLTNSVRARYTSDYLDAAMLERLYDQLASPIPGIPPGDAIRSSSTGVYVPFLADMTPGVTAISETVDVTPQSLKDALTAIVWTSRGEALQCSEKLLISAYTDYGSKRYAKVGKNMMESVDLLAMEQAVSGQWVERAAARAALNAGTHDATDAIFGEAQADLLQQKVPGFTFDGGQVWSAIMHPYVFHDIREGGNVDSIGLYQDKGIHLNFELGQVGPFRMVVSPFAKVFYGAGLAAGTDFCTTLASAASPLDKVITLTTTTSLVGKWLNICDAVETGSTLYPKNERVKFVSATSAVCEIIGEGANGGLRFGHATTGTVSNADSAYTIVFGGPASLAKLYDPGTGPFGKTVGPNIRGTLEQWVDLAWKFYGGYGIIAENRLLRREVSVSFEA
jgi:hypothetical protein